MLIVDTLSARCSANQEFINIAFPILSIVSLTDASQIDFPHLQGMGK